jgi:hypothetical protein
MLTIIREYQPCKILRYTPSLANCPMERGQPSAAGDQLSLGLRALTRSTMPYFVRSTCSTWKPMASAAPLGSLSR